MTGGYDHEVTVLQIVAMLRDADRAGADPVLVLVEVASLVASGPGDAVPPDDPVAAGRELLLVGLLQIARAGGDVADALAGALARCAGELGSSEQVLAGRPGSWEAALVREVLAGTVGAHDETLGLYREGDR